MRSMPPGLFQFSPRSVEKKCRPHRPTNARRLSSSCGNPRRDSAARKRAGREYWKRRPRSEEHTSELQSLMSISYAVLCLKKKKKKQKNTNETTPKSSEGTTNSH